MDGTLDVLFASDDANLQYDVTIMTCTLKENVTSSGEGGHLSTQIDGVDFVLYRYNFLIILTLSIWLHSINHF